MWPVETSDRCLTTEDSERNTGRFRAFWRKVFLIAHVCAKCEPHVLRTRWRLERWLLLNPLTLRKKRTSYGREVAGRRISAEANGDRVCRVSRICFCTTDSEFTEHLSSRVEWSLVRLRVMALRPSLVQSRSRESNRMYFWNSAQVKK